VGGSDKSRLMCSVCAVDYPASSVRWVDFTR